MDIDIMHWETRNHRNLHNKSIPRLIGISPPATSILSQPWQVLPSNSHGSVISNSNVSIEDAEENPHEGPAEDIQAHHG